MATTSDSPASSKTHVAGQPQPTPQLSPSPRPEAPPLAIAHSDASKSQQGGVGSSSAVATLPEYEPYRPKRQSRYRPMLRNFFGTLFAILKIIFVYGIPGAIFVILAFTLSLAIPFGMITAQGAITMVIGNGILKAAHLAHYTTNAKASAIGATGACIAATIIGMMMQCLPGWMTGASQDDNMWNNEYGEPQQQARVPWYTSIITTVMVDTLGAAIGCAILRHSHVDLKGIDELHTVRAGSLGGAVLGIGMIFVGPIILLAIGIILSPLWIAMSLGLKWVFARSNETWTQRGNWTTHSSSYCYSYGLCGEDEEIEHEIAQIHQRYN